MYSNQKLILCLVLLFTCKPILSSEADLPQGADANGSDSNEANPDQGDKKAETDSGVVKCSKNVMEKLGLEGQDNASDTELALCPNVKSSCCTVKDQIVIYDTWVAGKVKENLQAKFDVHLKVSIRLRFIVFLNLKKSLMFDINI